MENLQLNYEMGGSGNFLSVSVSEEINTYQLKMIEYNEITGILPISAHMLNGVYKFQYDITGKSRLVDALNKGECVGEVARKMLHSVAYVLVHAEEYLLTYKQFLLQKEYIFIDGKGEVSLVYLPFSHTSVNTPDDIQNFFRTLLLEYFTADGNTYFLNLLRYVSMPEYSLLGIMEKLASAETESLKEGVEKKVIQSMPEPKKEVGGNGVISSSVPELKKEKVSKEQEQTGKREPEKKVTPPAFDFAVPGMSDLPVAEKKEEKTKEKVKEKNKEKKSSFFGSFKGKEKEKKGEVVVGREVFEENSGKSAHENPKSNWTGTQIGIGEPVRKGTISMADDLGVNVPCIKYDGRRIDIDHFPFYVGREKGDYIIDRPRVSSGHLYFTENGGRYFVTDDNSSNHTYVNGRMIAPYTPTEIVGGDVIRLADVEITFYDR